MPYRIKSMELASMTIEERKQALAHLVDAARNDGDATRILLENEIREYELRYEMTSEEMRHELVSGRIKDTAEISRWIILLNTLDRYAQREARS